jgi:hypothetical protein
MTRDITHQTAFENAVADLEEAITDADGELRPITRLVFDLRPDGSISWDICAGDRLLYTAGGQADDLHGFLAATKMILELRAATIRAEADRDAGRGQPPSGKEPHA